MMNFLPGNWLAYQNGLAPVALRLYVSTDLPFQIKAAETAYFYIGGFS